MGILEREEEAECGGRIVIWEWLRLHCAMPSSLAPATLEKERSKNENNLREIERFDWFKFWALTPPN